MRALADLGCGAALSALTAEEKEASRAFWRKRAIEAGDKHSRARAELDALDKEHRAARKALEAELAQERALVRRLALRMFAAIDEERSRIARDLHDDQAQLLAAARIALEGGRDEARAIFKRLEQELRRKIRELRPAALGDQTLEDALRGEFKRLAEAGIEANLSRGVGAATLSRPVQQLCFQIAREALSNVLRHSRASRVEVGIERKGAVATISIADNGRGIDPGADRRGTGLAGLAERLQLMGGIVRIDSRPGATKLVAEIPEPV